MKLPAIASCVLSLLFHHPARAVVPDSAEADLVLGRPLPDASHFVSPFIAVDPATQKVFVGDRILHRILRFSSAASLQNDGAAEAVLGQADFTGGEPGTAAARLREPSGLWCDAAGRLWVADAGNNRVLRFNSAASLASGAPASAVLGQVNFINSAEGVSASSMTHPMGVVTDQLGNLYVADERNNRVLRFTNAATLANGASASGVLGQTSFAGSGGGTGASLHHPGALAISPNPVIFGGPVLWVADTQNNRVLKYANAANAAIGASASGVLGQTNYADNFVLYTALRTPYPSALAVDSTGHLYVGSLSSRVVRFDDALSKANGAPADGVLGQVAFNTSAAGIGPAGLDIVRSLALGAGGRIFIGDQDNHRVMRHEAAHAKVNGADADGVLGQTEHHRYAPHLRPDEHGH